jgi:hypothetical protein
MHWRKAKSEDTTKLRDKLLNVGVSCSFNGISC